MVIFVDYKSNCVQVFLAKTKDAAANFFLIFLVYFEKRFDCKIHVLRTDSGGEYENVDLFCSVARQRSKARNQASNGKSERMHRTVIIMARCKIFACGLPFQFWEDAIQYAAYIINRPPTNVKTGRVSPLQFLRNATPTLGEIVTFGSPCTVFSDPRKKPFAQRCQRGVIIGIGDTTKG